MLSTEQLLIEEPYDSVTPPPATATSFTNEGRASGMTLTKFVGPDSERPDLGDVLSWADQLLEAVHGLHTKQQPIIHSGIAPSTVEIDANNKLHLRTIREAAPTGGSDPQVNYKPLEQIWDSLDHFSQRAILNRYTEEEQRWLSQQPAPASDIYSVAATLYAVLTGVVPADALDRSIASMEDKPDPLVNPSKLIPSIPPEISDVILKAMSVRRDDRYYSAVILRQVFKTAAVRIRERLAGGEPDALVEVPAIPAAQPVQEKTPPVAPSVDDADKARQLARKILAEKAQPAAEPAPTEAVEHVEEASFADVLEVPEVHISADTVLPDEPIEPESVTPPVMEKSADDAESAIFAGALNADVPARSFKLPAMAAAALVVVAALGFGIFKLASSAPNAPTPSAAPTETSVQPAAVPDPTAPAVSTAEVPTQEPAPIVATAGTEAAPAKPAKQNAAQPEVKKPAAPAAAKTPPPKKQLTVDDLLN